METKTVFEDLKRQYARVAKMSEQFFSDNGKIDAEALLGNNFRFISQRRLLPNLDITSDPKINLEAMEENQPQKNRQNEEKTDFVKTLNAGLENPTKLFRGKPKTKNHKKWKLKRVLLGHTGWVRCSSFDPSNVFFATGASDRTIKFWDLATGNLMITLTGHIGGVRALEISRNHPYLFSCSEDKAVRCWDLNCNKTIRKFNGHLSGVYTISLHPQLDLIASGGRDSMVRLWDIRTRHQVQSLNGHTDIVNSVAMQADEPQLISASSDSTIRLWDIVAGKNFNVLTNHKKGIRALRLHPIEYTFVSCAQDNIKLWKCPEGSFVRNFEKNLSEELINCIDTNGNDLLVSGSDMGMIRFYDWETGDLVQEMKTLNQPGSLEAECSIYDIRFDWSATRMITCECDKTIKVWEQEA